MSFPPAHFRDSAPLEFTSHHQSLKMHTRISPRFAAAHLRSQKEYTQLFVDGASGSGKTRMGWELYRRFAHEVASGTDGLRLCQTNVESVSYAYVDITSDSIPEDAHDNREVRKWLAQLIIKQLTGKVAAPGDSVTLRGVLSHALNVRPEGNKRGALILHIDNFHRNSKQTRRLLSVTHHFTRTCADMDILPVCTGLYTDSCYTFDASGGPCHVALRFFRDLQKTWEIVHSAAFVVAARGELPPILNTYDVLSAHPIVRCLVEDTGGWPIAAVHLGVNIIADYKKRKAELHSTPTNLFDIEASVVESLTKKYPRSTLLQTFGVISEFALFKVSTLALSPLSVSIKFPLKLQFFVYCFTQLKMPNPIHFHLQMQETHS